MFSFNYRPKQRLTDKSVASVTAQQTNENAMKVSSLAKTPLMPTSLMKTGTPSQRSAFGLKLMDSPLIKKPLSQKNDAYSGLTVDSTVDEINNDSKALKDRVAEELEKIETWKELTALEANKQLEEIKHLKSSVEDITNKLQVSETERNELIVKLKTEANEREDVLAKMNTTREMLIRLQDYSHKLEIRFAGFDEIREIQELVNQNRGQQYNRLIQRFQSLDLQYKSCVSELTTKLNDKNSESIELKKSIDTLNTINDELEKTINELTHNNHCLNSEVIQMKQKNEAIEAELLKVNERSEQLAEEANKNQEMFAVNSEQNSKTIENLQKNLEAITIDSKNEIQYFKSMVQEMTGQYSELKIEVENKDQLLSDFESKLKSKEEELEILLKDNENVKNALIAEKTRLSEMNEGLNQSLISLKNEKEEIEISAQNEKQLVISKYEKTIEELESNIESLREETIELNKTNEENKTLVEELESKANQTIIEKESIEQQLKNELNELKEDFDNKMDDFSTKITNLEFKVKELTDLKDQNETIIKEIAAETEILKLEKQSLENKVEREEESFKMQISNMSTILESSKADYKSRIDDKDERIREYKREMERNRISMNHLSKKCELLESEKQSVSRELQQLTLYSMRPTHSSPNQVLTPKFLSPIESSRLSVNHKSESLEHSLNASLKHHFQSSDAEDEILSAKQELKVKLDKLSHKPKPNDNQKQVKAKRIIGENAPKTTVKLDESDESVYEIFDNKLKKIKKHEKNVKDIKKDRRREYRYDSPIKVNMSLAEEKAKDLDTDEYDINQVLKEDKAKEPLKKKIKTVELKTYSKKNLRAENIVKGRPTPTKSDDLSWLDF